MHKFPSSKKRMGMQDPDLFSFSNCIVLDVKVTNNS